ncbi:MAG: NAD(P)H-dependent glycerol-3-phosphate dehydrogenase [Roseovarius sp.]
MITILGSGAFGTALAIAMAEQHDVTLWTRDEAQAHAMQTDRENTKRLPGVRLPDALRVTAEPDFEGTVLLAVPMQQLRGVLEQNAVSFSHQTLVACCKGIELNTSRSATQVIADVLPDQSTAILTGPSFAADVARGLPTALTLACTDDTQGQALQSGLSTMSLRIYRTTDVIGAELGGALKNVMAIACGAVMGAGLGVSARAALMTRGFAEMSRMAAIKGADPGTLAGLSGFGDLALTCTSDQSRNYMFGFSLGQGVPFDPQITVEGAATARAVMQDAATHNIDMPVTKAVVALAAGKLQVHEAMDMLLSRPLKEE